MKNLFALCLLAMLASCDKEVIDRNGSELEGTYLESPYLGGGYHLGKGGYMITGDSLYFQLGQGPSGNNWNGIFRGAVTFTNVVVDKTVFLEDMQGNKLNADGLRFDIPLQVMKNGLDSISGYGIYHEATGNRWMLLVHLDCVNHSGLYNGDNFSTNVDRYKQIK